MTTGLVSTVRTCQLCSRTIQFGPIHYEGRPLRRYGGIVVCDQCYADNAPGWHGRHEETLIAACKSAGEPVPPRNFDGWLPRE